MNDEFNKQMSIKEAETLSQAPTQAYQGLKKAKKLAKKSKKTEPLPKYINENKYGVQFGIGSLPSDDMNMIMKNGFGLDFERKVNERREIEMELEKLANYHQKNLKHNIYLTKA